MRKKMMSLSSVSFFVIIMAVLCYVIYSEKSSISEVVVSLTAILGASAIYFQMKRAKDIEEGEFIFNLNTTFSSSEEIKRIYKKLNGNEKLTESDRIGIVEYLTFFESIYTFIDRKILGIGMIDDLFAYRFFLIVNNIQAQELELIVDAKFYKNIYSLDYVWRQYRLKNKKEIVFPDTELSKRNNQYMDCVYSKHI